MPQYKLGLTVTDDGEKARLYSDLLANSSSYRDRSGFLMYYSTFQQNNVYIFKTESDYSMMSNIVQVNITFK